MRRGVVSSMQQRSSTGDDNQASPGQPDEVTSSSRASPGKTVHTAGLSPRRIAKTCIARQSGLLSMLPSLLLTSPLPWYETARGFKGSEAITGTDVTRR
ncbi:hypothetical protein MRX96_048117 [Rhipicephalus microplus]